MTINQFIAAATLRLSAAHIPSARLDALVLLSDALQQDKSWILAHGDEQLRPDVLATLQNHIATRAKHMPIAYIRGHQEFYGREFIVDNHTLIPRPATEALIDVVKTYARSGDILDVGTGSGAIAITLALELPRTRVDACDISPSALDVAQRNATALGARVHFFASNILDQTSKQYHAIVANLPYVARNWDVSPETAAEPALALFADDDGLELIKILLSQTPDHLLPHGYLFMEADPRQHVAIEKAAHLHGLVKMAAQGFALCFTYSGKMAQ